jgi:hypothetical protein
MSIATRQPVGRCAHPITAKLRDCLHAANPSPCSVRDRFPVAWFFDPILMALDLIV